MDKYVIVKVSISNYDNFEFMPYDLHFITHHKVTYNFRSNKPNKRIHAGLLLYITSDNHVKILTTETIANKIKKLNLKVYLGRTREHKTIYLYSDSNVFVSIDNIEMEVYYYNSICTGNLDDIKSINIEEV